jgi:Uma2 family endonuclease
MSTAAVPTVSAPPVAVSPPPALPVPLAPAIVINGCVHIPAGISDLATFRLWARSEECPEKLRLAYLSGVLWVDLTMEQLYSHNDVKTEVATVLRMLVKAGGQGRYLGDGMLLSNTAADLSTIPDGQYVSFAAFKEDRVREVPGKHAGVVELEGSPEMVLEVVSESSVEKDMTRLPVLYWRAGILEFWRIDARGAEVRFEILRREATGYVPATEPEGWWRSTVLGRSFRLTQQPDARGQPLFTLEHRP